MAEPLGETVEIRAPAQLVWDLVSDVTRMPQYSPELATVRWISATGTPQLGARFRGTNTNGRHRWSTTCEVTALEQPGLFSYRVSAFGLAVSEWSFRIEATPDGCRLTESTTDRRGALIKLVSRPATGVRDRTERNRAGIRATVAAIKAQAERGTAAGQA